MLQPARILTRDDAMTLGRAYMRSQFGGPPKPSGQTALHSKAAKEGYDRPRLWLITRPRQSGPGDDDEKPAGNDASANKKEDEKDREDDRKDEG